MGAPITTYLQRFDIVANALTAAASEFIAGITEDLEDVEVFELLESVQRASIDMKDLRAAWDEVDVLEYLSDVEDLTRKLALWDFDHVFRQMCVQLQTQILEAEDAILEVAASRGAARIRLLREDMSPQRLAFEQTGDWKNWRKLYTVEGRRLEVGPNPSGTMIRIPETF